MRAIASRTTARRAWLAVIAVLGALLVVRNLIALGTVPQGAYVDESSIGYNAWAIATHGVDEHGARLPLFFTAFGEYKNPVYVYALSALLRVAPLTVTTERLPAALFGLVACMCMTMLAWRRSQSLPVTAVALALTGLTPWLTVESRVGFEVIAIVAAVAATLLFLAIAQDGGHAAWYLAAGVTLGLAVFAYSTGRVSVALFAVALVIAECWGTRRWWRPWLLTLVPVAGAYAVLAAWNAQHPGALTARFNLISIGADGAPPATIAGRFAGNYLTYFSPQFLFVDGDHRARHATQYGGMLLWVTLPLLLLGLVALWRRRREAFARFVALGLLAAPVSAALTEESVPHSLRAAVMLPFLLVVAVEGLRLLAAWTSPRRAALLAAIATLAVQGSLYTVDLFATWPARSALDFDAGEIAALVRAHALAGSGTMLVSSSLDQPYIQAAFALRPAPPSHFTADSATPLMAAMHMALVDPLQLPPDRGAVLVLSGTDPVPGGAQRLFDERSPRATIAIGAVPPPVVTVVVVRLP